MMLGTFFKRLKHSNPQVRLKAAEELGRLEDERALEPLKEAFEAETDPKVRQALQAAGKRIQQAAQARAQPHRPPQHDLTEDALAAQIVADAMAANMPEPSLGDALTNVAAGALLFGAEGAALGALWHQAKEIDRTNRLLDEARYRQELAQAMADQDDHETQDETTEEPTEEPAEVPDKTDQQVWLDMLGVEPEEPEADEPDEPPAAPGRGPVIRRLKPKQE